MNCIFDSPGGLVIGINSVINAKCRIDTRGGVTIGSNVSISNDVIILTADHDMDNHMTGRKRTVIIEDNVWIGTRAIIMPGTVISKGAVIAAGAVVTKDVPSFGVVAGVPATIIKYRKDSSLNYSASYKRLFQ